MHWRTFGRFYQPARAKPNGNTPAARGTTTAYSFTAMTRSSLANTGFDIDNSNLADGDPGYHPVKQKKPNNWGLYDMHGDVAEWCMDAYSADWYKQFAGKTVNWKDTINWPTKQYPRVIRGGSWNQEAEECRSAARYGSSAKLNIKDPQLPQSPHWLSDGFWVGFRVMSPVAVPDDAEKHRFWDVDDDYTKKVPSAVREIREVPEQKK